MGVVGPGVLTGSLPCLARRGLAIWVNAGMEKIGLMAGPSRPGGAF